MERNTLVVFKLGKLWPFRGLQHERSAVCPSAGSKPGQSGGGKWRQRVTAAAAVLASGAGTSADTAAP